MIGHSLSLVGTVAAVVLAIGLGGGVGPARAADDATAFVTEVGSRFVAVLTSPLPLAEKEADARALVMQAFDMPAVAEAVVGPYWKTATEVQREEFLPLFTAYLVRVYVGALADNGAMRLTSIGMQSREGAGMIVGSRIAHDRLGPSPRVEWRVASIGDRHWLVDVSVDGISMVRTQRHQLGGILYRSNGNLEVVLRLLRQKLRG